MNPPTPMSAIQSPKRWSRIIFTLSYNLINVVSLILCFHLATTTRGHGPSEFVVVLIIQPIILLLSLAFFCAGAVLSIIRYRAVKPRLTSLFVCFLITLFLGFFAVLSVIEACDDNKGYCRNWQVCFTNCQPATPLIGAELLATDMHISVAQHTLVIPFIVANHSILWWRDDKLALDKVTRLLHASADPENPLLDDDLYVTVKSFYWTVCPLLTREWARSACKNPAILQALPYDGFELVDLHRLQVEDPSAWINCRDNGKQIQPLPQKPGEAVMVCEAKVYGGKDDQDHYAVVRIDDDLGARWIVISRPDKQNGETAEAKAEREGKAIVAFVQYALGKNENFPELHAAMCRLRRPGSVDGPNGSSDCERATLPAPGRN